MKESFSIGRVKFDPECNSVTINEQEKRIKPQTMLLMCYLAKNSERVVSKDEIMASLWREVVVGDEAVARLIFNLRNVLGDDAKKPKFIETIPTKGYRLLIAPKFFKAQVKHRKYSSIALLIFALALISLLMIFLLSKDELNAGDISDVSSVTSKAGLERHFNVNPKTNKLIYVHTTNNSSQLFFTGKDQEKPKQLTDSQSRKRSPKWLNEDTFLYIQARQNDYAITRQNLAGKKDDLYTSLSFIYWVSKTKQKLYFTEEHNLRGQPLTYLKSIDLVTGNINNLSEKSSLLPANISFFEVSLSEKRMFISGQNGQLMWLEVGSNKIQEIQSNFTRVSHIDVIDEHNLLVTGENKSASGIWKINLENNEQRLLLSSAGGQKIVQAKLHQGNLFYSTYQFDTDIYLFKEGKSLSMETINTPYNELYPKFIDDQNSILFVSNRGGGYDLWLYKLNTSIAEQITHLNAVKMHPPVISLDNQLVAISYERDSNYLTVFDLTSKARESNIKTDNLRFPLSWSVNKQILYLSEYSDNINLFEVSRDLTKAKPIAKNGGLFVHENNVTNSITFADYTNLGLKTLNETGELLNFTSLDSIEGLNIGEALIKHNNLYIASRVDRGYKVQKVNMLNGSISSIISLPTKSQFSDISSDGEEALYFMREMSGPQGDIIKVGFGN